MLIPLLQLLSITTSTRAQRTSVSDLEITNLSPLLRYTPHPIPGNTDPEAGWVTDEYGTWTDTTQSASVSLQWWGGSTYVYGNLSRVVTRVNADHVQADNAEDWTPHDWWLTWPRVQYRPDLDDSGRGQGGSSYEETMGQRGVAFRTRAPQTRYVEWEDRDLVPYQRWNVTFELDQTSTYNRLINVSRAVIGVGLPTIPSEGHSTRLVPAPETVPKSPQGPDDWSAASEGSWVSIPAPFNTTRYQGRRLVTTFPPATFDAVQDTAGRVLSTNTSNAPLRLHAPEEAALFVLYGAVGPEQGEFSVRLSILDGESEKDFHPHNDTRTFTANRQEEAMSEALAMMWLDPRQSYALEIVSLEEGRNLAIQAVAWTTSSMNGVTGNWWSEWNDQALGRGKGLSGGQIAGIVVGAVVAVALLIGLKMFFWRLRRQRASNRKVAQNSDLSPSQTLSGEAAASKPTNNV